MTTAGWIICVLLLIGYFTFVIWALVLELTLFALVNSRLPEDKQILFIGSLHWWEMRRQSRILFPDGNMASRCTRMWIASGICFLGAIATAYIFHLSVMK